jgi:uncharacterized membrane protein
MRRWHMAKDIKVLFAGEAIYILQTIYKGRDSFSMGRYTEHGTFFLNALKENGIAYDYIPTNKVAEEFPWTLEDLKAYDAVIEEYEDDPFLVAGEYGKGRVLASAVDCAYHGAAPSF